MRQDVLNLTPYKPSKAVCEIKLDANENPYEIPNEVKQRIEKRVKNEKLNFYCDASCDELRGQLSIYTGLKPEQIFVGSGGDEIISDLIFAFAGPGRDVIIPVPSFGSYETFARISGANVIKVPLLLEEANGNFSWDLDVAGIKRYFRSDIPQLMFLCYPNNPTGDYFDEQKMFDLIDSFNGIIVIDEAYFEFGGKTFSDRLSDYPNIVIVRTFSKAFCIAGLRVGYALGHEDVIEQFYKVKLPYNVNTYSQIAATEILKNIEWVKKTTVGLIESRDKLVNELKKLDGITVYPSSTNFLLCKLKKSRDYVYEQLLDRGILTRRLNGENLDNTLRFNVGTPEQNDKLLMAFKQIL